MEFCGVRHGSPTAKRLAIFAAAHESGFGPILLKKSVFADEQNFPEAPVRSSENYMGGHVIYPIFNRQPS
jgi:hypothetical protein